jgi:aminopeptidase N
MRHILGRSPIVATVLACWAGFAGRPAPAQQADTTSKTFVAEPLRTPSDRPVDIRNIRLDLRVNLEKKTVDSKAKIAFRCIRPTRNVTVDAVGIEIKQITLSEGDKPAAVARYEHDRKKLMVDLGTTWRVGQTGSLQVEYQVCEPKQGLYFFAPSQWKPSAPLMVWSHGQAITNRYWIPCIDEPDQRQTTEVIVTVPAGFEAVSNGKLVERKNNPDQTTTFDWVQDKPHPSYCVT